MENVYHRLAAALDARGLSRIEAIPHGMASLIARDVGISEKTLKGRKWQLKKSDGDPEAARVAAHIRNRELGKKRLHRRYHSEPEFRAAMLKDAAASRRRNYVSHVFKNTRSNAHTRGLRFELTREQVAKMLAPMVCSATGLPLLPKWDGAGRNPWWPSLDQIDPCGGYTPDNVRVVCWAYNVMKGELTDPDVLRFASALVAGNVTPDADAAASIEAWRSPRWGKNKPRKAAVHLRVGWKESAKDRGIPYELTTDWVREQLRAGVCTVTGLPLTMTYAGRAHRNPLVPSIDRIDGARGYEEDNVRIVCGWYNYARQDWPDEVVRDVATALVERQRF